MTDPKLDELRKDFSELISKIDMSGYSPYSREFMTALFVGQMGVCMKILMDDGEQGILADIREEVDGMEKYIHDYETTGDPDYKQMAIDEHRHASMLVAKARTSLDDVGSAKELRVQEERLGGIRRILP